MNKKIERAYGPEVIQKFPENTTSDKLEHIYTNERTLNGNSINFQEILGSMISLRSDVDEWYFKKTGNKMDTYKLGDLTDKVKNKFYEDPRFSEAFIELGINPTQKENAYIPWWNELSVGETGIKFLEGGLIRALFSPMHSFEVQLSRRGFDIGLKGASIDGLVFAAPDKYSPNGYITLGVRGGTASLPNTYHVVAAGSLRATEEFKKGTQSITDIFVKDELVPEIGNITTQSIDSIRPISRNVDWITNNGGSTYVFEVKTKLPKKGIKKLWVENKDPDKREHKELVFIPATQEEVWKFIQKNYKGIIANRKDRKDNERFLLHAGALDLCACFGISPNELKKLYQEGEW